MKNLLAEFLGTFALVLLGCGAAVIAGAQIGPVGVSFAFGLATVAMAYGIGPVSGCHINPAVSLGMVAAGRMSLGKAVLYVIGQVMGAIAAAWILKIIATGTADYNIATNGLWQNGWGPGHFAAYTTKAAFVFEAVATFLFVLVVLGATAKLTAPSTKIITAPPTKTATHSDPKTSTDLTTSPAMTLVPEAAPSALAGLAIGLALVAIHLVGINVTGVSVNPARSIGPALMVGGTALGQLWLFIAAPVIGAVLAGMIFRTGLLTPNAAPVEKTAASKTTI